VAVLSAEIEREVFAITVTTNTIPVLKKRQAARKENSITAGHL